MLSSYKKSLLFEDRLRKANLLIAKYPGRVPVICEKYQGQDNPDIDKNKYLAQLKPTSKLMGFFFTHNDFILGCNN